VNTVATVLNHRPPQKTAAAHADSLEAPGFSLCPVKSRRGLNRLVEPPFIPSEAEGSAVQYYGSNEFVIPTERMSSAGATKFHRKSGVAQWRDLLFSLSVPSQRLTGIYKDEIIYIREG
jgi:hypothetical protein